jgi:hypothetical protein
MGEYMIYCDNNVYVGKQTAYFSYTHYVDLSKTNTSMET